MKKERGPRPLVTRSFGGVAVIQRFREAVAAICVRRAAQLIAGIPPSAIFIRSRKETVLVHLFIFPSATIWCVANRISPHFFLQSTDNGKKIEISLKMFNPLERIAVRETPHRNVIRQKFTTTLPSFRNSG